ncbi:MAG: signal peptidase I [Bacilli bacterium]|nr:signal peptidase I [Bacilli bacterium]
MKLVKNIFIKIIWLILILLVTFNIYNFVSINVLKKDIASINGYAILEVVSGSMEPTIKIGDIIVINTKKTDYKAGDIITFYDVNGSFVTHRLVNINDTKMTTKGDANDSADEEMDTKNIVGKYVTKISGAGKLMASLKNPFVMLLILVIGIVSCLLMSTDENLIPKDLTDEEKAYLEYKKLSKEKPKKDKDKKQEVKEEPKEIIIQEAEVIGEIIEVSVEELETQEKESLILREQLKEELIQELKDELRKEIRQENKNKTNNKKKKKKYYRNQNNNQNYKNKTNNNKQQRNNKNNSNRQNQHRKNNKGHNKSKNQTRK